MQHCDRRGMTVPISVAVCVFGRMYRRAVTSLWDNSAVSDVFGRTFSYLDPDAGLTGAQSEGQSEGR